MLEAGQVEPVLFQIWELRRRESGWLILLNVLFFDVIPLVFWSALGLLVMGLATLIPGNLAMSIGVAFLLISGVCVFLTLQRYRKWHIVRGRVSCEPNNNSDYYYADALTRTQQPVRIRLDLRVHWYLPVVNGYVCDILLLYNPKNPQKDVQPFTYEEVCGFPSFIMMILAWVWLGSSYILWFWNWFLALAVLVGISILFTRLGFIPFHLYRHYRLRADGLI